MPSTVACGGGAMILPANEACDLVEASFEYVTGDYHDGGKIFRKRK